MQSTLFGPAACLALAAAALAQPGVDNAHKFAWSENIGWTNWRDAANASQGIFRYPDHLRGYIWAENVGWIRAGAGEGPYSNISGATFGVNIDPSTGNLSGFAWSENTGWINFAGGAAASPARPARFDADANRLRGYAWGENIGWLNLDHATHFVAFVCPADFNGDGQVDFFDYLDFIQAFSEEDPAADFNGDGQVDFFDYLDFVAAFSSGC